MSSRIIPAEKLSAVERVSDKFRYQIQSEVHGAEVQAKGYDRVVHEVQDQHRRALADKIVQDFSMVQYDYKCLMVLKSDVYVFTPTQFWEIVNQEAMEMNKWLLRCRQDWAPT